jgi:hypothetical protein
VPACAAGRPGCLQPGVIPSVLGELLQDKDAEKSERVWKAMLQMEKIDIRGLQQAHENKSAAAR